MILLLVAIIDRICKRYLGFEYLPLKPCREKTFLNIVLTDLRWVSIEQKARSFYSVIETCLARDMTLNIVVPLGRNVSSDIESLYFEAYQKYLADPRFNIVFSKPDSTKKHYLAAAFVALIFSLRLSRKFYGVNRNIAVILSANYLRMWNFYCLFDDLPSQHWLGLTGNIELQALLRRRDIGGSATTVNALQFGQASMDQHHFFNYSIDRLFVYDSESKDVYKKLGIRAAQMLVSGSPEFEFNLSRINERELEEETELGVLFIDQPVGQRSEYSSEYLTKIYEMLRQIGNYSGVSLMVKAHPRGSAFVEDIESKAESEDIAELLSKAHVVIGFFSNLIDLALMTGRKTFCLGADRVLDAGKIRWMQEQGCIITDSTQQLDNFIRESSLNPRDLAREVILRRREFGAFPKASQTIIGELNQ